MTVAVIPLDAENTIGAVSADHGRWPPRSAHPFHTSTTGWPSTYTASAPPPTRRPGNMVEKPRTTQSKCGSAAPNTRRPASGTSWEGIARRSIPDFIVTLSNLLGFHTVHRANDG